MSKKQLETEQLTNENELKKEYLKSYQIHVRRVHRITEEIQELRAMRTSVSVKLDGMPHGSSQNDLSGFVSKLDELERELAQERYQRIKTYQDICHHIKQLKNQNENDVLFYRYIKGMKWWEIAERMNYTERWIRKLHGYALEHFQLPKEFLVIPQNA